MPPSPAISSPVSATPAPGAFEILADDPHSRARLGRLWTAHGPVDTPAFMPVGTQATVKTLEPRDLSDAGVQMVLANAYHLLVRPGLDAVAACGGLHRFMGWDGPILTDSGGFQVFSLAGLRRVRSDGVTFQSHVDGRELFLGPVESMAAQRTLGSDVAMCFDECPPYPCERQYACQAVERTLLWAASCRGQDRSPGQLVFGIVQGGIFADLRERCARELAAMGFDGYAVGGVSVGEPEELLLRGIGDGVRHVPADRPRYTMGLGAFRQLAEAVAYGVDLFDCVMPTRHARNGSAFTRRGSYPVKAGAWRLDPRPIEEGCTCYACQRFPRAYVRHLLNANEILGVRLLTLHNLHVYMSFMRELRESLASGGFAAWRAGLEARLASGAESAAEE
jgi:queuine tRNA-ribosyltransferase